MSPVGTPRAQHNPSVSVNTDAVDLQPLVSSYFYTQWTCYLESARTHDNQSQHQQRLQQRNGAHRNRIIKAKGIVIKNNLANRLNLQTYRFVINVFRYDTFNQIPHRETTGTDRYITYVGEKWYVIFIRTSLSTDNNDIHQTPLAALEQYISDVPYSVFIMMCGSIQV